MNIEAISIGIILLCSIGITYVSTSAYLEYIARPITQTFFLGFMIIGSSATILTFILLILNLTQKKRLLND